jgi:hypothetical protein
MFQKDSALAHYVFQSISSGDLASALGHLVTTDGGLVHVAIDGKRLWAASTRRAPACIC